MGEHESEILRITQRLIGVQKSLGLSNRAFAARYRKWLRSEKSWILLKEGRWAGALAPEKWHSRLDGLTRHLEANASYDADTYIDTLPFITLLNHEFERLMGSGRDRRCLVCLAPEGMGKSWWASSTVCADPGKRVHIQISETARNRPCQILAALAHKLSVGAERSPFLQINAIIAALCALPEMVILIDEGHNGGSAVFPIVKELIDKTPARFVYLAFPTQFDLVRGSSTGALAESRQFLRRCIKPIFDIYRDGVTPEDVEAFLVAHGHRHSGELEKISATLAPVLRANYNITTLADAIEETQFGVEDEKPTLNQIAQEVYGLCSSPEERRAALAEARKKQKLEAKSKREEGK